MAFNLRNRNFLKELDFTKEEFLFLLKLSADLKAAKYGGYEQPRLQGKNIALIFEKGSTRTRCASSVRPIDASQRRSKRWLAGERLMDSCSQAVNANWILGSVGKPPCLTIHRPCRADCDQ